MEVLKVKVDFKMPSNGSRHKSPKISKFLSVTCDRSVVFSGYTGFLYQ